MKSRTLQVAPISRQIRRWVFTLGIFSWLPFSQPGWSQTLKDVPTAILKSAAEAYRRSQFADCAKLLAGLENQEMPNQDSALFLQGQCNFYSGQMKKARQCFLELVERFPKSPHWTLAKTRAADCAWELGSFEQSIRDYKDADAQSSDPRVDRAVGLFHEIEFRLQKKIPGEASRLWGALRRQFPTHPLTQRVPSGFPEPSFSVDDALVIAKELVTVRDWQGALTTLDSAPEPSNRQLQYELGYLTGRILFDMRGNYEKASEILYSARDYSTNASQAEQAWFWASRALSRIGRDEQSIQSHLAMVERYPRGKLSDQALFYAGWLELNLGRYQQAQQILPKVWQHDPKSTWAEEARWFYAWSQLQQKMWDAAISTLAPQINHPSPAISARAGYWSGVAHFELGHKQTAAQFWEMTSKNHPLTWYSLLATHRLGNPPGPHQPPRAATGLSKSHELLDQADDLISAGLHAFASLLLRMHEKDYLKSNPGRQELLLLLEHYRKAEDFHRPWYLSVIRGGDALRRLPSSQTRAIWDHSYPLCYQSQFGSLSQSDPLLQLFLWAIMRTESGFDPMALSTANARGLMQMIPPVARSAALELGLTLDDADLFDPEMNIRLASFHLGKLAKKFKRQWPLVAASYNADANAVKEWCRKNSHLPLDAFVEAIPYTETRGYVKRVIEAFARYSYLQGYTFPPIPWNLGADCGEEPALGP